ncbi:DNA alkylation repair protein [Melittangium boletus]|uniref:DNA alkylation repair protein n=1 Tax=Melittangium boletus DSM 14713 TaxID=1294270 RepID=A0A250I8K2_9BACT|nr:DNA alkylation repair protein [Melittangium boletus]ATB27296.1 DNA alkylation repair protein [Melittangium boletus DSM 14713]
MGSQKVTSRLGQARTIQDELASAANPEKAAFFPRFFKTGPGQYAEGDVFLGVTVPEQRRIARRHKHLPLEQLRVLLRSEVHEHRLTGFIILVEKFEREDALGRDRLFAFCREHLAGVNNWDLVDLVAPRLMGVHLLAHPEHKSLLDEFVRSPVLWERRIAIMATFAFIRAGEFSDTLRLAEVLLQDPHDLIHKAVGWMLREVGKRELASEEAFLDRHAGRMPRTMLRYAIEKFPLERREHYMKAAPRRPKGIGEEPPPRLPPD